MQKKQKFKSESQKEARANNSFNRDRLGMEFEVCQSERSTYLKNLLLNQIYFEDGELDESLFETDLVIKIEVPQKMYIDRSQRVPLASFISRPPKNLLKAYQAAFQELFQNMEKMGDDIKKSKSNDNTLQLRQMASFLPIDQQQKQYAINSQDDHIFQKKRTVVLDDGFTERITLNCKDEYSGVMDAFIIQYNSLIFMLQHRCGFQVRSFLMTDEKQTVKMSRRNKSKILHILEEVNKHIKRSIFVLLHLPHYNLMKAADKYGIKKQIDYRLIDPYVNEPLDKTNRPLKYNASIKQQYHPMDISRRKQNQESNKDSASEIIENEKKFQIQRKTVDRKIGLRVENHDTKEAIINEAKLSHRQIDNFLAFTEDFEAELFSLIGKRMNFNCFNNSVDSDAITIAEKQYLHLINRGKYNPGVERRFVQVKKQRKYFQVMKSLSKKYGYKTFPTPTIFVEFQLLPKKEKFFHRLQNILKYREKVCSPYGDLTLFNKMERIKLSYLVLRAEIRVENLYHINGSIFALNDNYEKYGDIGSKDSQIFHYHYLETDKQQRAQIRGGLDGKNLYSEWSRLMFWKTDFKTMRDYLGESKTFEVFVKAYLIYLFAFLVPFGIVGEVIKQFFIVNNASLLPQFYFNLFYLLITTIFYGIFMENYKRQEEMFMDNYVESNPVIEFRNEYRGPYIRNPLSDNPNTYTSEVRSCKDRLKAIGIYLVVFFILGVEIGFYYGIRAFIISYSIAHQNEEISDFYLWRPNHLLGYSIFFIANELLSNCVFLPFIKWLTQFENQPTKQAQVSSENNKLYTIGIGVELIGPVDLVFIQYFAKTSCSAKWCYSELEAYAYCRYFLMICFVIVAGLLMLWRFFKSKSMDINDGDVSKLTFSTKLSNFLQFVYTESQKEQSEDIKLLDETIALVHFCTFVTVFPLAPAISFLYILINYNIEREELIFNKQRPISKSEKLSSYRPTIVRISHWLIFFNFSQMIIQLQWVEYIFPNVVLSITSEPTPEAVATIKISTIILFMLIYELILLVTERIVRKLHSVMDDRKRNMYEKFCLGHLSSGTAVTLNLPNPIRSISRIYNNDFTNMMSETSSQNLDQFTDTGFSNTKKNHLKKKNTHDAHNVMV